MVAIYIGNKKEMTIQKQRIISATKKADRVEYYTLEGMSVSSLYSGETKLTSVASKFWDFA